jgi:hypothetical protein
MASVDDNLLVRFERRGETQKNVSAREAGMSPEKRTAAASEKWRVQFRDILVPCR